ncbi:aldo/keto reductase [Oceanobacillus caeni]|uniref:Oxidoreductase n=1 Tax=Oceanobacillus caeni TaxID=405946 RepID=A0ABR5MKL2_9BACI|nr:MULTISPECIES: aldo/keto reductase [Bacillaceae]KKE80692.1 oxidoreductase [Bacilli bacterium VT-13-104]PZD84715.1 aldo/keto reductase [Bacilli bacterium]KPH76376.1 oxidoreductase [Oceanobacillus caeni]MCR1834401.1 aldo/keto reductase [Oceanobacillus caeni]PZD85282.1 aldo/keto reductase [Bacilli bacterium]
MKKSQLGKSDLFISELTLGGMSLGTDINEAKQIIDLAIDKGINHIDTADLYDFGLNEEIIGEIIHDKRENIILTTKVGNHFNKETKDWFWDPSKDYILREVKESLKRLKTDYIDFYMLHGGTLEDPISETIEAFEQLKQDGIIRAYGISSIRPNVIREFVKHSSIDAVMMQYNLLDRRPEEETLELLQRNQISVLARGPLAKGMLSNRSTEQINKKGNKGYLDYSYEELLNISEKLTKLFGKQYSIHELALKYVLKHPAVTSTVFGASSINQINENTNINLESELPNEVYNELKTITKPIKYKDHR